MREVDCAMVEDYGIRLFQMMENAGLGLVVDSMFAASDIIRII